MQDKAIAAIGEWQLEESKDLEPVDLYIENMFPGKDYQMLLLVFELVDENGEPTCEYKGIDIEKVSAEKEEYRKYAFRNGTSKRAGDVTITTRLTPQTLKNIKELQFVKITGKKGFNKEVHIFKIIEEVFLKNYNIIENQVKEFLNKSKKEKIGCGISLKIMDKDEKFLFDYEVIKDTIVQQYNSSKIENNGTISQSRNKMCASTGTVNEEIYGFAAPFVYSSADKPGFISGFFNKKLNWRNYPISAEDALKLEIGRRFITENLKSRFYGHDYLIVPNPILKTSKSTLKKIINTLRVALGEQERISSERKLRAEEHIMKVIANEENYFNLDILFYKISQASMKIQLHLEEQLPSRFRKLFIEIPREVNKNKLYHNIYSNSDETDLKFSFKILKQIFSPQPKIKKEKFDSPYFLKAVHDIFLGYQMSSKYLFDKIMNFIRLAYLENLAAESKYNNYFELPIKKAIMLISYLQELEIINYNQNYKYMEIESNQKKESTFNLEGFNEFIKTNSNFLDSDIKVGIFAVGVLVRFLYAIQSQSLNTSNPPFENKLKGYKLNPEILIKVYTEALDKIQKYQKNNYVYTELREIINNYFILKTHELTKMTNNELSFYFVAGLEMGKQFKRDKQENQ